MGVGSDSAPQVGTDKGAFDDFSITIRHHRVAHLQFVNHPAIGAADAAFRFTLGNHRRSHVGPPRHELGRERPAGKRLFDVQSLPAGLKLAYIALTAQIVPDVFDRYVERALEQIVRYFRTAVGEAVALPLRGVKHDLFLGLLDLRGNSRCSQERARYQNSGNDLFHWIALPASRPPVIVYPTTAPFSERLL